MKKNIIDALNEIRDWKLYKKGMCDTCIGLCCYMPVEVKISDLHRMKIISDFHLDLEERHMVKAALDHPGVERFKKSTDKFTLTQRPSGACYFLDTNGRCTIYEDRPDTCRNHPKIGPRPNHCAYYPK